MTIDNVANIILFVYVFAGALVSPAYPYTTAPSYLIEAFHNMVAFASMVLVFLLTRSLAIALLAGALAIAVYADADYNAMKRMSEEKDWEEEVGEMKFGFWTLMAIRLVKFYFWPVNVKEVTEASSALD